MQRWVWPKNFRVHFVRIVLTATVKKLILYSYSLPFVEFFVMIKPQCMREGYGSCCVYLSVCYHASGYIPSLYVQSEAAYSFLYAFKGMYCVDFAENVSFGRYGVIYLPDRRFGSF